MIRWVIVGRAADGHKVERWFVRSWYLIDLARAEMAFDAGITEVLVIALCLTCGEQRIKGRCTNNACRSRQPALEAAAHV